MTPPDTPERTAAPGATKRARPLVLLVEDSEDTRQLYAMILEDEGMDVREAKNGSEALALAAELRPDVILMDLTLPVLDGREATRRLKRDPRTAAIPVVALTGQLVGRTETECDALL